MKKRTRNMRREKIYRYISLYSSSKRKNFDFVACVTRSNFGEQNCTVLRHTGQLATSIFRATMFCEKSNKFASF